MELLSIEFTDGARLRCTITKLGCFGWLMAACVVVATVALLYGCSANVTEYPPTPLDAGQGGAGGQGCAMQADCVIGDGLHDICYEYKAYPLTDCVMGDTLPCDGHEHCEPFGWCDPAQARCQAEGASTCLVKGALVNCTTQAGPMVCCENSNGEHYCALDYLCDGEALEP